MSVAPLAAPPPDRRSDGLRVWLYPFLVLAASCSLAASQRDPQDDLDGLAAHVRDGRSDQLFFRHDAANVGVHPGRGWTLTLFVGDTRRFAPGGFLVLTRIDGRLEGELLSLPATAGAMEEVPLDGPTLDGYLRRSGLDLTGLDAAIAARSLGPAGR